MIQITADTRRAVVTNKELLTVGSAGIQVQFTLSEDWNALSKLAVFRVGDDGTKVDVVLGESLTCVVPSEVLTQEGEALFIGIYGANGQGTVIIPTIWASAGVVKSGTVPNTPADAQPTPEIWAQILGVAQDAEQTAGDAMSAVEAGLQDLSALEEDVETAEEQRVLAEQGRVTAEQERAAAESSRVLAENNRAGAETARASAEQSRATAETARVTAENGRVSAEEARAAAEEDRESHYAEYVTTVQGYANAASASATAAAGSATDAASSASAASTSAGQAVSSATAAAGSATDAASSASAASTSAGQAVSSATAAAGSATDAASSASAASTSAGQAVSSASSASNSASSASSSASSASTSATTASNAATTATTKAGEAAASATSAEAAQAAAEAAAESIEDSAAQIAQNTQDIADLEDEKYEKPVTGIPATDLASVVQASLGKADSAYQKPAGGIPATDLASAVQTSLGKADSALQTVPVSSVNTKTGAVNLASGDIAYDESATYQAGSVGAELSDLTRQLSDKQDKPATAGTAGQVLGLDNNLDPVWVNQSGGGGGTSDYTELENKPQINGHTLDGNQSASDLGLGTYSKPASGIPKTDLASDVQASLGKADTALQTAPVQSVAGKTGAVTLSAGDIGYDGTETYQAGSVGAEVSQQKNAIDQKQDATSYVTLSGTIVIQTGADNTMYLCGELAELTFTAPATGQTAIRFTSGTTPTVATFLGVTWLNGFDPSAIEASKTYEVNILNGLGCAAWT